MRKYYFDLKKISVDENFPSDARECAKNIFENQEAEQKKRTKIWGHIEQNAQPIETSVPIPSTSNSERGNSLDEALSFVLLSHTHRIPALPLVSLVGEEKFEKPKLCEGLRVRVEPYVDTVVSVNICLTLNKVARPSIRVWEAKKLGL
ncbi:hypothetical protein F8M41_002847 [Gigaspora margarita]|uniref:Uncharacterized protein n=1 Tax=Gigaspora margarita TaxID=4874 RepID=A0A8H3XCY3_GIGMA|nr:hypothetical protein F8M41_002847 [Gigaspora margarita]